MSSDLDVEVAVVGAGLMGAATAWVLSRRGHSVALIEAFDVGHRFGSSHGTERIYRRAYLDPMYVAMTGAAEQSWAELEDDADVRLRTATGGLDHGARRDVEVIAARLTDAAVAHELMPAAEAMRRWPAFHFEGPVLFHPDAGTLDADATVSACVRRARDRGAVVLENTVCTSIDAGDRARLRTARAADSAPPATAGAGDRARQHAAGPVVTADTVVVAAGAWLPTMPITVHGAPLPLPELTVTEQQTFHFPLLDQAADMPIFVYKNRLQTYGLRSGADGGPQPSYKVAVHDMGTVTTATARSGAIERAGRTLLVDYVRRFLPGLDPDPSAEYSCLYTNTASEDFVLDRVGAVVIASPCSGHGAKFTPLIGAMTADLALGIGQPRSRFALAAHR